MAEIIDQQGALVPEFAHLNVEQNTAIAIVRAEIDTQIATALRYPRKIQSIAARIMSYATMDEETAAECCYALVYGKKQRDQNGEEAGRQNDAVEGPSIRLAEIALQAFGNCRAYARVINVDRKNKFVEAEGIFHDLETNALQSATSRRAIAGQRGNLFPEHLIITTGNAACSIAKRNAILAGIPRGLYRPAYNEARKIIAGTAATLVTSRQKVVESYAHLGISAEQICVLLGIDSMMEFTVAHVVQMRAMFASIKSGEVRAEDAFAPPKPARQQPVQDPLSNEGVPDHADHSTASGSSQTDEQRSASREEALTKGADVGRSDQQHGIGPGVSDGGASGIRGTAEQSKPDNAGDGGKAAETGEEGDSRPTAGVPSSEQGSGLVSDLTALEGDWRKPDGLKLAEIQRDLAAATTAKAVTDVAEAWDNFITYAGNSVKAKAKVLLADAKERTKPKRGKL